MNKELPFLAGHVALKSDLSIEEVAKILSERLFGGLKFGGKEKEIYEEVPAIFIDPDILGFNIVLQGYPGINEEIGYSLSILPNIHLDGVTFKDISLDDYLIHLLKVVLKDVKEIIVVG
ncbi:MAG: hypothetical protein J0H74_36355 [Chitinophagaceae bacterium]|nr:hypothetical protein [Chitinophagaceae bacterium]